MQTQHKVQLDDRDMRGGSGAARPMAVRGRRRARVPLQLPLQLLLLLLRLPPGDPVPPDAARARHARPRSPRACR
jgi:hypothetical protein